MPYQPLERWHLAVNLAGAPITPVGQVAVEQREGKATLADLDFFPTPPLDLPALTGQSLVIDVVDETRSITVRRFTGKVDTPEYDPNTGRVHLTASDVLAATVGALSVAEVDTLTGAEAQWSAHVFSPNPTRWQYALDRMSTRPASLDADAYGVPRVTDWAAKATPDLAFTDADVVDGTPRLTLPSRQAIRNKIACTFTYVYPRLALRKCRYTWAWNHLGNVGCPLARDQLVWPVRQMIQEAAENTGWQVQGISYTYIRDWLSADCNGNFYTYGPANPDTDGVSDAVITIQRRYAQTVHEVYAITMQADQGIAQQGELTDAMQAALEVRFDSQAWEDSADMLPAVTVSGDYGEDSVDMTTQAEDGRAVADAALSCLLARGRAALLASHRQTSRPFTVHADPAMDVAHTYQVWFSGKTNKGKCRGLRFEFDTATGRAHAVLDLAISGTWAVGLPPDDDGYAPPTPPAKDPPDTTTDPITATWGTYTADGDEPGLHTTTATLWGTPRFVVRGPVIQDADRDWAEITHTETRSVPIPQDLLEYT